MYSSDDAISMFNCVPFTCDVFWWRCCSWCCFYVQLCPFHLWCILVMMLFLCSIVSLSLVMYSGNDAVSMFNCVPFTCDVFWWWCCFYVQLCPFHLWCILVMMLFLCSIVSRSFVMYSGDDAVSMFNCVPFTCDVFLVMMLFLCSIVSLSLVMYSGDDAVSMFNCVPFTCDVFVMYSGQWCCFYVQLCPFHLCSGDYVRSIVLPYDVFWWWSCFHVQLWWGCCFYVQLCPFHLWCILVTMLFLCPIVSY